MDEIGELALDTPVKLLRALQEYDIYRIRGVSSKRFDVRIIAATNQDLDQVIEDGSFRADL